MICVIPYKPANNGRALRYALRSIEMYAPQVDRVEILGPGEPWLRNVTIHQEMTDYPDLDNWSNVVRKLGYAAKHLIGPSETFIWYNDDIYLLAPLQDHNPIVGIAENSPPKPGQHQRMFRATLKKLENTARTPSCLLDYEIHAPMFMHAATVQAVIARWGIAPYAYRTMIGNWRGPEIPVATYPDPKVREVFQAPAANLRWFSTSNPTEDTMKYAAWMAKRFPAISRFEAGHQAALEAVSTP